MGKSELASSSNLQTSISSSCQFLMNTQLPHYLTSFDKRLTKAIEISPLEGKKKNKHKELADLILCV